MPPASLRKGPLGRLQERRGGPCAYKNILTPAHHPPSIILTAGRRSQSTLDSLAILQQHWPHIQQIIVTEPDGPWMYAVTTTGLRPITL